MKHLKEIPEINSARWLSLADLPYEVWKPIKGYESKYQISNYGRVKALERIKTYYIMGSKRQVLVPSRIRVSYLNFKGYYRITLHNEVKDENVFIHRLVAIAFLPNPQNLPQVNHKDENKTNNIVWLDDKQNVVEEYTNLEWCTALYNNNFGTKNKRISETMKNSHIQKDYSIKRIIQYTINGVMLAEYSSATQAGLNVGADPSGISKCCRGIYKQFKGYLWRYK